MGRVSIYYFVYVQTAVIFAMFVVSGYYEYDDSFALDDAHVKTPVCDTDTVVASYAQHSIGYAAHSIEM